MICVISKIFLLYACLYVAHGQTFDGTLTQSVLASWGYPLNSANSTRIYVLSKGITTIPQNTFIGYSNTTMLSAMLNSITKIEANTFAGLDNLESLFMQWNQITYIDPIAFQSTPKIKTITLYGNRIMSIEAGTFTNLYNLQHLYLQNNSIARLDPIGFKGLSSLIELNLGSNKLTTVDPATFQDMGKLTVLLLDTNPQWNYLDPRTFSNLVSLQYLRLCNNTYTNPIDRRTFITLRSLKSLDLDRVQATFDPFVFAYNTNLTILFMSQNMLLKTIDANFFYGATALKFLNMNWCNIQTIDPLAFSKMPELSTLDLSYNSLISLSEDTFVNQNNISVHLAGNMIFPTAKFNGNVKVVY